MKKNLLMMLGIAAALASCTNEEILVDQNLGSQVKPSEGITFGIVDEPETRGEFVYDNGFKALWNAEIDRIYVAYWNAKKGYNTAPIVDAKGLWNGVADADEKQASKDITLTNLAQYKTTQSGRNGYFTSASDGDMLNFTEDADGKLLNASFRVFRGAGNSPALKYHTDTDSKVTMTVTVPAFNAQTQPTQKANFENFFMVSELEGINNVEPGALAVGESLGVKFQRPFAALAVYTQNYDKDTYGKLKSVALEFGAETKPVANGDVNVDIYGKVYADKNDTEGKWSYSAASATNAVKLTLGTSSGLEWDDKSYAYFQLLPIGKIDEKIKVTFNFEKGSIVMERAFNTTLDPGDFKRMACDLNALPYVYFEGDKKLVVNTAMPEIKTDAIGVIPVTSATTAVEEVISNIELNEDAVKELKKLTKVSTLTLKDQASDALTAALNSMTSVKNLTLTASTAVPNLAGTNVEDLKCDAVTEIPADAYTTNTTLKSVDFPAATIVGNSAFNGCTALAEIDMPKVTTVGDNAFKGVAVTSVGNYNIESGVASLKALTTIGKDAFESVGVVRISLPLVETLNTYAFGLKFDRSFTEILLPNYDWSDGVLNATFLSTVAKASLETIDLSGIAVVDNKVATCTNLKKVILAEGAIIGDGAFLGCTGLTTVENLAKVVAVGNGAFDGCTSLAGNIAFGADVATIGSSAFRNTAITSFDFANITAIGESAFEGCTALSELSLPKVTALPKNAFKGCTGVGIAELSVATSIAEGALANLKAGAMIYIYKKVETLDKNAFSIGDFGSETGADKANAVTRATIVGYNLSLNKNQSEVDGASLIQQDATDKKWYKTQFTNIFKVFQ